MVNALRVGIAGLGTVGTGVVKIIKENSDLLAKRCGREIAIAAVSARFRAKRRDVDVTGFAWEGRSRGFGAPKRHRCLYRIDRR